MSTLLKDVTFGRGNWDKLIDVIMNTCGPEGAYELAELLHKAINDDFAFEQALANVQIRSSGESQ